MVQVFGKRILGGVGAPDPRMSESFGAGVNTALGQRQTRQAMQGEAQRQRILEQKFAWEGEDRADAKRRAAAAAAAAAAAKAQNTAVLNALAAGVKLSPLATGVPMGKTYGPRLTTGDVAGLLPPDSAPAGVKVPAPTAGGAKAPVRPTLTLGRGGGSAASSSGGRISSSSDGAPAVKPPYKTYSGTEGEVPRAYITPSGSVWPGFKEEGKTFYLRPDPKERPGDFAAQATARELAAGQPSYNVADVELGVTAGLGGSLSIPRMQARIEELQGRIAEETRARGEGGFRMPWNVEDVDALNAEIQQIRENIVAAQMQPSADLQSRGVLAPEGPEASAPVDTAEAPAAPAAPAATPPGGYSLGLEGQPVTPARLSFGPKLGAMPDPIYGTVTDRVVANPPGRPQPVPDMQVYTMDPGRPGRELQQGIDTYSEYVRQAQIYAKYGKTREYLEMATKAKEMENTLFFLQGAQALQELAFNSPQRLSMVLSEQFGREIGIQPNQNGSWDLYADGMLAMQMSKPELSTWARSQIDSAFAAAEAARAATYAEEQMKSDIQQNREIAVQSNKAQLDMQSERLKASIEMQKALFDAQVNPGNVDLVPDPSGSGDVYVFDKLSRQLGVITTRDYSNPGQSLPAPTFITTSQ